MASMRLNGKGWEVRHGAKAWSSLTVEEAIFLRDRLNGCKTFTHGNYRLQLCVSSQPIQREYLAKVWGPPQPKRWD